jgi:hypothetical protein
LTSIFPAQLTRLSLPPCGSFTTKCWRGAANTAGEGKQQRRGWRTMRHQIARSPRQEITFPR